MGSVMGSLKDKTNLPSELKAKKECPHTLGNEVVQQAKDPLKKLFDISGLTCNNCSETIEKWVCLNCSGIFCERPENRHRLKHHQETAHHSFLGTKDLSFWCYQCDAHVFSKELGDIVKYLQKNKCTALPEDCEIGETDTKNLDAVERKGKGVDSGVVDTTSTTTGTGNASCPTKSSVSLEPQVLFKPEELKKWRQRIQKIASLIKSKECKNIVILTGAGISTAAGIPDFRSPGTGLYDNLQKYNLPRATAVFELDYFEQNPKPFFEITKDFLTKEYKPTYCHYFIKLLEDKGKLLRNFTQNIDGLELKAGVSPTLLCQAHGTYTTSTCTKCSEKYDFSFLKKYMDEPELVIPTCEKCKCVVKPDIVFFGESLPSQFLSLSRKDLAQCDLLIVMGTSLEVYPVAGLVHRVDSKTVRVLINRDLVGPFGKADSNDKNVRDYFIGGGIDKSVRELAKELGWDNELEEMYQSRHSNQK